MIRTESEIVGFLIKSPVRGAIAIALLSRGPLAEESLAKDVFGQLGRLTWTSVSASGDDVRRELGELHAAGLVEPVAEGDRLVYRISHVAREAVDRAMAPLPTPDQA